MKKKLNLLYASVVLGIFSLMADPAILTPIPMTQPDGTTIAVRQVGDEYGHYLLTEDGIPVMRGVDGFFRYTELSSAGEVVAGEVIARNANDRTDTERAYLETLPLEQIIQTANDGWQLRRQAPRTDRASRMPAATTGDVKRLVLLIQFSDVKFQYSQSDFNNMLNQEGYNYNGTPGSARDYFMDQSNGQFRPSFDVYGPFTLSKSRSYYGADSSNGAHDARRDELCYDVCDVANSSVDFSQYASGSDVDMIYIFYAGYSQSESGNSDDIWAHQTDLGSSILHRYDGKNILSYACSSELQGGSGSTRSGIGVFIHEYSHTLGLPDFYDTNNGGAWGMGYWSVMSYGNHSNNGHCPVGYTAYERAYCGWLSLSELPSTPASISLENFADSKKAYKISSSDANQYFVLENRQRRGWDSHIPTSGLMITKVDYNASAWNSNDVNINASRQRMTVVPADNSTSNESGDLYPYNGNNSFTSTSVPASVTNTGIVVDRPITNIMQSNGIITFDVMGGVAPDAPVAQTATDITQVKFTAHWTAVSGATSYELVVEHYKNDGTKDNTQTFKNITGTSYTVTGLNNEHYYVYYVTAINDNNEKRSQSSNSVRVEMSDEPALPTPTGLEIYEVSETSFKVRWNQVSDAQGYKLRVTRRFSNGVSDPNWVEIRELPYQSSAMIVNKLDKGYIYYCQIQAYNWNGVSRYSDVVMVEIAGDVEPVNYAVTFSPAENGTFEVKDNGTAIASGTEVLQGTVLTVETTPHTGYVLDAIMVNGSEISGNTFMVNGVTTVAVTFKEETQEVVEYSTPSGTMHSNGKTYVERIYTEGAETNIDKTWTSAPGSVYQLLDEVVVVKQGTSFNLHLNAHSLGSESSTTVCQDLRYTTAVIFSDWNRDGVFTQEEVYGDNPPAHNVTGNMAVMEITKAFTVPANASLGESRIRVIYSNAWGEVATANTTNIQEGMAYDIVVKVNTSSAIDEVETAYKVYGRQGQIVVACEGNQRVDVINITGQVVLSTHVDGYALLDVPTRGVYIVRCGENVARVVVR